MRVPILLLSFLLFTPSPAARPEILSVFPNFLAAPQSPSSQLAGVWVRERSDATTYQKITLTLRADGTYTKILAARVNGSSYGGTHEGTWTARGSVVHLSGDGNWPALDHDLSEFTKAD